MGWGGSAVIYGVRWKQTFSSRLAPVGEDQPRECLSPYTEIASAEHGYVKEAKFMDAREKKKKDR